MYDDGDNVDKISSSSALPGTSTTEVKGLRRIDVGCLTGAAVAEALEESAANP
jgi:hypothetical protein